MIRLAVIGTGFIAHEHVKAAASIGEFEICAAANRRLSKALDFGRLYGIPEKGIYDNYVELLDREKPQAVLLTLPHYLHREAFIECARRKIHILVEKPMAIDSESCRAMNECARNNGIKVMVGHTQRYNKYYAAAKKAIETSRLGRLMMMRDTICYNYFWDGRPAWQLDPDLSGGGIAINYGVHTFDRVQFLSGCNVERVFAHIDWEKEGIRVDSAYQIQADLTGGVSVSMTCTGYSGPFVDNTDMIFQNGILRVVSVCNGAEEDGVWLGSSGEDFHKLPVPDQNSYVAELTDFLRCLKGECPSPIDGEYGERIVRQVEAAYLSNKTKKAVEL